MTANGSTLFKKINLVTYFYRKKSSNIYILEHTPYFDPMFKMVPFHRFLALSGRRAIWKGSSDKKM
jgi:hypothetical protein